MNKATIIELLASEGAKMQELFEESARIKGVNVGDTTYLRGLIEYSNVCRKDCLYCGIRKSNACVSRYTMSEKDVLDAASFAYDQGYGSVVLQGGESTSNEHIRKIECLIKKIKTQSNNKLGITLSLGEQTSETYNRWANAGAHRYLLRIESSDKTLYRKIHPDDNIHLYENRLKSLRLLRNAGFQVGTGVMIGLPFQSIENLADDLMFMRDIDIDMCGMGPYIEHKDTPLYAYISELKSLKWRLEMSLKMIAVLRILMPDINITATTALEAIDPLGREKAINVGANIIMPNITPYKYKSNYKLYENKPIFESISLPGIKIGYNEWGDSLHFKNLKLR